MAAPSPFLSRSLVAARDKGSPTSLRASSAWSSLKAHVRSFVASNNNNTTPSPARAASTPHLVAIVGGAVGAVVVLAVVLALVHVLRVRRKVERLRRSTNVLGPELTPMPILRSPGQVVIIDHVAVSQVSPPSARGSRLSSVRSPGYQRYPYLPGSPSLTSPKGPLRGPPLPPRKLTIDVGVSRAIQHMSHLSAGPTHSPYRVVVHSPGPTSFPRHSPHSAATQRTTER